MNSVCKRLSTSCYELSNFLKLDSNTGIKKIEAVCQRLRSENITQEDTFFALFALHVNRKEDDLRQDVKNKILSDNRVIQKFYEKDSLEVLKNINLETLQQLLICRDVGAEIQKYKGSLEDKIELNTLVNELRAYYLGEILEVELLLHEVIIIVEENKILEPLLITYGKKGARKVEFIHGIYRKDSQNAIYIQPVKVEN